MPLTEKNIFLKGVQLPGIEHVSKINYLSECLISRLIMVLTEKNSYHPLIAISEPETCSSRVANKSKSRLSWKILLPII